jgi:hypothetical protein
MRLITRSGWGAARPEGVTLRDPSLLKGVVVHWFGSPSSKSNHDDCDDLVRSVQRSHQAGEFVDIAYNHLVCRHGFVYEGRGFGVQTGANGWETVNEDYAAVCYMAGERDISGVYSQEGKGALSEIVNRWLDRTAGDVVRTHGSITGSQCPGPTLTAWVEDGGWKAPDEAWRTKRLATLRAWFFARLADGWTWAQVKATHNWQEFKDLGGS